MAVEGARRRRCLHEIRKASAPRRKDGGVVEAALAVPYVDEAAAAPCCCSCRPLRALGMAKASDKLIKMASKQW